MLATVCCFFKALKAFVFIASQEYFKSDRINKTAIKAVIFANIKANFRAVTVKGAKID